MAPFPDSADNWKWLLQPIIDKKFIAYGGVGEQYLIDVVGTVATVGVDTPPDWIWIVPDPPYEHLAVAGNRLWPKESGEEGRDFYVSHIEGNGYGGRPILKCETYPVGGNLGPGSVEVPRLIENGASRPARPHDRVRIRGLYVIDYGHQPYFVLHTESFTYQRGIFKKAGYAHAELHPWAWHDLQLADPSVIAQPRVTVVAPYNDEIYTWTYFGNLGAEGHLIEESHKRTQTAQFTLSPSTPRPYVNFALTVKQKDVASFGDGRVAKFTVNTLSGAAIRAAANAAQVRPAPSPSPAQPPVVYGSPTVGPLQQTPDRSWCSEHVAISLGEPDAAAGHRGMPIRLVNSGTVSCVLNAYPDVAFDDTDGWAMDILTVHGGSFMTTDPGPRAVTVAPGAAAQAALGWNAMAGAGDVRVGAILVAPFSGVARTRLPADLDMVSGGYVAVTGWSLVQPTG